MTFGAFIAQKRRQRHLTLRQAAQSLGITAAYLSDVEKGKRNAFGLDRLRRFAVVAQLEPDEMELLYDLAGENRGEISPDVNEYISQNPYLFAALRRARTLGADEQDWKLMLEDLMKRKGV